MSKVFKDAAAEAPELPAATQDKIGREPGAYLEELHCLQGDIEEGIRSLDAGAGKTIDVEDVIKRARLRYDEA